MKEVHMSPVAESKVEQGSFLDDIEKRVGEIFSAQKSEVEQSLTEKINREKEEAQKKIEAVNQEFTQVRSFLEAHKVVMAELQSTEEHLRGEIRGHFDRAQNYQKMMENAAGLAGEELEKIGGLNQELEKVRLRAEEEYENLKKNLAGYAGIAGHLPAPPESSDGDVDWNEELVKLNKVRDLLATLRQVEFAQAADVDHSSAAAAAPAPAPESVSADEDGVKDDVEFADGDPAWSDIPGAGTGEVMVSPSLATEPYEEAAALPAEPEAEAAPASPAPDAKHEAVLASLARYRRTEPINNGLEIGFFATESDSVLDAESFMTAVGTIVEGANQMHAQLTQTGSVKDLFLLKQEILNQQEVLRKVFFRVVRFCEKEGGQLPGALSEIISSQGMKDVIERLTMANWSDPSDFKPFLNELTAMKRAFEVRTVASGPGYHQGLLDLVEGRN
jgi:hypothetical protein